MLRPLLSFLLGLLFLPIAAALPRHVGAGQPYPTLDAAVAVVQPGDSIIMHAGIYPGGFYFANLQGTSAQWITICNAFNQEVIFEGGANAIQLSDPAYLRISGLIFQHQTGNGVNIDDGGSYDTPAHSIVIEHCTFRDMAASGNNDQLKLSGLDWFYIYYCTFQNGAAGGSGIDMVGCHQGMISNNRFENLGSNSIQCKGGSEWIRIEANFFRDGGQRTLNLGGSTGLQFFRPDTAHFEAANLQVYANIIIGSWAPIAYVGAVNVQVVNNTIYQPENWVIRILQETVDPDRFVECGDNSFINNIVYFGNSLSTHVNVGPDTRPETFLFSHNLWYNADNTNWSGPNLPVAETGGIIGENPLFASPANDDFSIPANSPATGAGWPVAEPGLDFAGNSYASPRSVGAMEGQTVSIVGEVNGEASWQVIPNPSSGIFQVWGLPADQPVCLRVFDLHGRLLLIKDQVQAGEKPGQLDLSGAAPGSYWLQVTTEQGQSVRRLIKQ